MAIANNQFILFTMNSFYTSAMLLDLIYSKTGCSLHETTFTPRYIYIHTSMYLFSGAGGVSSNFPLFFLFLVFFNLTYSRWTSSLPSCLWSQRIFPSLPGSRLTSFLSRCKFSTLTTRQPMVEFYLLTFPRFPLRKKEHKSYFGKNRTHDFRTSRCAVYLLDHSGDEGTTKLNRIFHNNTCNRFQTPKALLYGESVTFGKPKLANKKHIR